MVTDGITLRPATSADCEVVFRWRNDPFILSFGSSRRAVTREEHERWFAETLASPDRRMFVIQQGEIPIGQIRFERKRPHDCVISVYLLQEFTGRGLGTEAIRAGCETIFAAWDVNRFIACVRRDNPASRAAFLKAAFQETESEALCPPEHVSLVLCRAGERRESKLFAGQ